MSKEPDPEQRSPLTCVLDLVQWATDPTWGSLGVDSRTRLLRQDAGFLSDQLRNSGIKVLLLNGRSVINLFSEALCARMTPVPGTPKSSFMVGDFVGVCLIGWTVNIQSSFDVSNDSRKALAERVAQLTTVT